MSKQNKSLSFGQYIHNDKILNKKVPENPKYRNVKPAIDTGKNVRRHIDELKEKQLNLGFKKDEIFKRIKFSSYVTLALNVARLLLDPNVIANYGAGDGVPDCCGVKKEENNKIANVLMGVGEIDLRNEKKKPPAQLPRVEIQVPYLLLDVRERERYCEGHLRTAMHYPSGLLSRSSGYETEEMKQYKNSPDIIIVYDDDESIASRVATTLVERGYENVFIISGGLKLGTEILPAKLMSLISTNDYPVSKLGSCGMVRMKIPPTEYFTQEDIEKIELYMEDIPIKDYNKTLSGTKTSSPQYGDHQCCSQWMQTGESPEFASRNNGYLTYRKDSASSVRSTKQTQNRIASGYVTDARPKSRKAPWK